MRSVPALLLLASSVLAAPQATATTDASSGPQYENVTISVTDASRISYFPTCASQQAPECVGAWFKMEDSRFSNGVAMMTSGPSKAFGDVNPYLTMYFKGSAMYLYEWYNGSTSTQTRLFDNTPNSWLNLSDVYPQENRQELSPVLAWSLEGLDPYKTHMVGLQQAPFPGGNQIIIDRIVITQIVGIDNVSEKKSNKGMIAGATIGGLIGLLMVGGLAWCCIRNRRQQRVAQNQKHAWEGTTGAISQKFDVNPSAEIMASERMAREGRLEEAKGPDDLPDLPKL